MFVKAATSRCTPKILLFKRSMEAWENFLLQHEKELGVETVRKWLRPLKVSQFDAGNLYLQASDSFQILWFEEHVRKKILNSFVNKNNRKIKVHLSLNETPQKVAVSQPAKALKSLEVVAPQKFSIHFDTLDPFCTFHHFIESKSNPLPQKLLYQLTGYQPATKNFIPQQVIPATFNPIYLYGSSGSGKTHLLMATANALSQQNLSVAYARAETFTEHVVTAIRAGEMSLFRNSYRNVDVLIIDDVHLFGKKWATQEELFHTFNTLHVAGKQIILSADSSPADLQNIEPRLISRFEWGIVLPLEIMQKEDRKELLKRKADSLNYPLNPKIAEFILESFTSSPKAICKALEALILRTHLGQHDYRHSSMQLSLPFVQQQLSDLIAEEQKRALTPEKIIQNVAEYYGIRSEDILSKAQNRECVLPRQMAMYICRIQLALPFAKIGQIFSKDHSTVMSSVKLIQRGLDEHDSNVASPLHSILKQIRI